ncbi:MAG: hypothetical protein EXS22_01245 [Pedosphaera sp.]|nr:hypothetical protein [Pedosphaera sp.]
MKSKYMNNTKWMTLACAVGLMTTIAASAQDTQLLLNKLIEKGILTRKEADDLQKQSEKEQRVMLQQAPADLPGWVKRYNMSGDLRLRNENFNGDGANTPGRERFRYRLRYGIGATLTDSWAVGFRLASGATDDPLSVNETFGDGGERDPISIDQAYAMWTPNSSFKLSMGKIPNPFKFAAKFDSAVIDGDYNPEGIAASYSRKLTDSTKLGFTAGGFILSESSSNSQDGYAGLAQLTLNSKLTSKLEADLGAGMYSIFNRDSVTDLHQNRGNTLAGNNAALHAMNPFIVDGALTYKLDSFPGYPGAFPISIGGAYINNPGASEKNEGFMAGITFGKAAKAKEWSFGWQYREVQADALYDQWMDSDFGAYGVGGSTSTYRGGPDARGHVFGFNYMLSDSWTFAAELFQTEAITANGHDTSRFRFDLIWKF